MIGVVQKLLSDSDSFFQALQIGPGIRVVMKDVARRLPRVRT